MAKDRLRQVQNHLASLFRLWIFRFDFDLFLVPFRARLGCSSGPPGGGRTMLIGPVADQVGLEIVLVRFPCRLVARHRFFDRLGVVFGSFLGALGAVLGAVSAFQLIDSTHQLINSSIQPINASTHRFNSSTYQLIDSTNQPINSRILECYTEGR